MGSMTLAYERIDYTVHTSLGKMVIQGLVVLPAGHYQKWKLQWRNLVHGVFPWGAFDFVLEFRLLVYALMDMKVID